MDRSALNTIELCAGVGMLGEGFAAGLRYLGIDSRCVLYAEREAYPVAVLEARMAEGSLDAAPVWFGDFTELPAARFRGVVDCVVAGFPCQDISIAGRRAGLDGERSGLFFRILDIARDCGAWCLFLENVSAITSATATAVDQAAAASITGERYRPGRDDPCGTDSAVLERAAARIMGELADSGWDAEWLHVSASAVGASHERERWFCLAWRRDVVDAECAERRAQRAAGSRGGQGDDGERQADGGVGIADAVLDDAERVECIGQPVHARPGPAGGRASDADGAGDGVGDTARDGWREGWAELPRRQGRSDSGGTGGAMEHAERPRWPSSWGRSEIDAGGKSVVRRGAVAEASGAGCEGRELDGSHHVERHGAQAPGPACEFRGVPFLFAPGPADPRWGEILAKRPELAPSLKPDFRQLVDGLAFDMGDSRAARLRCVGNGVVAASAATAAVELVRRARA